VARVRSSTLPIQAGVVAGGLPEKTVYYERIVTLGWQQTWMFSEALTRLSLATCNLEFVQDETMGQDDRTLPSLVPENSFNNLYHDAEFCMPSWSSEFSAVEFVLWLSIRSWPIRKLDLFGVPKAYARANHLKSSENLRTQARCCTSYLYTTSHGGAHNPSLKNEPQRSPEPNLRMSFKHS